MDVEKQQQPPRATLAESAYASPVGAELRGIGGRLCKIATSGRFGSVRSKARLPPGGDVILQRTFPATAAMLSYRHMIWEAERRITSSSSCWRSTGAFIIWKRATG